MAENHFRPKDISPQQQDLREQLQTVVPGTVGESSNFLSNLYQQRSDVPPPADSHMHYFEPTSNNNENIFASLDSIIVPISEQHTRPADDRANEGIPISDAQLSDAQPPIYEPISRTFYHNYDRYYESLNELKVLEQQKSTLHNLLVENSDKQGRILDQKMDLKVRKDSYEEYGLKLDAIDNKIIYNKGIIMKYKAQLKERHLLYLIDWSYWSYKSSLKKTISEYETVVQQLEVQRGDLATAWEKLQNRDSINGSRYTINGNFEEALRKTYEGQEEEQKVLQNKGEDLYDEYQRLHAEISKIDEKIQQFFPEQTF